MNGKTSLIQLYRECTLTINISEFTFNKQKQLNFHNVQLSDGTEIENRLLLHVHFSSENKCNNSQRVLFYSAVLYKRSSYSILPAYSIIGSFILPGAATRSTQEMASSCELTRSFLTGKTWRLTHICSETVSICRLRDFAPIKRCRFYDTFGHANRSVRASLLGYE